MFGNNNNNSRKAAANVVSSRRELTLPKTPIMLCDFFANCSVAKPRKNAKKQWKKQAEKVNEVDGELKKETETRNGYHEEATLEQGLQVEKLNGVQGKAKQVQVPHLKKKKKWELYEVHEGAQQEQLPQLAKEQIEICNGGTKEAPLTKNQAKLLNAINGVAQREQIAKKQAQKLNEHYVEAKQEKFKKEAEMLNGWYGMSKREQIADWSKKQSRELIGVQSEAQQEQLPALHKKQADKLNGFQGEAKQEQLPAWRNVYHGVAKQEQVSPSPNGYLPTKEPPKVTILRHPKPATHATKCSTRRAVKSCPRIPTPCPKVPPELQHVHSMTSAEFRSDYAAHLETMRTRQKDQQHMRYFEASIEENPHLFKGRRILVLSCGTGTLALMAARAGAAHVYALDHSRVTDYAQLVVKENHMEHIITVLHGRVEEVEKLPQVDGIICNWMGYSLLYESELLQLLQARDRWLKQGGFILPDLASLYLVGAKETQLKNDRCNWWLDVYGFNMNAMRRYALSEPRYARVKGEHLLTQAQRILSLNLLTATLQDLQIDRSICLQVQQEGSFECFVIYFDVKWSRAHEPLLLCCNPWRSHAQLKSLWLHTLLFVDQPFIMRRGKRYMGHLQFKSLRDHPHLDMQHMRIEIEFFEGTDEHGMPCNPLLHKTWLMLPHFQSTQEVDSCQDKLPGCSA